MGCLTRDGVAGNGGRTAGAKDRAVACTRVAYVRDPEGNVLELIQPLSSAGEWLCAVPQSA